MQSVHPEEVVWSNFVYPIHHAEHAKLNQKQRQAVLHYQECAKRLLRRRDEYRATVAALPRSAFGVELTPSDSDREELFDKTQLFFAQSYTALGALASVHGRIRVFETDPPISGVEKFLTWWTTLGAFLWKEDSLAILKQARDFRTVLEHPQQIAVYNWRTHTYHGDRTVYVVLHGEVSSSGKGPEGSNLDEDRVGWSFHAPNMDMVVWALLNLTSLTFHAMAGRYPLPEDESTCTWEADGFGSAPFVKLEEYLSRPNPGLQSPDLRSRRE